MLTCSNGTHSESPQFYAESMSGVRTVNRQLLSDRTWTCEHCNTHHDRDINAAINILKVGETSTFGVENIRLAMASCS